MWDMRPEIGIISSRASVCQTVGVSGRAVSEGSKPPMAGAGPI